MAFSIALTHVFFCQLVLMYKWDVAEAAELVIRETCTSAGGVPHLAAELVQALEGRKHHLEGLAFGGGPVSAASVGRDLT